jgi:hypothetical protein
MDCLLELAPKAKIFFLKFDAFNLFKGSLKTESGH